MRLINKKIKILHICSLRTSVLAFKLLLLLARLSINPPSYRTRACRVDKDAAQWLSEMLYQFIHKSKTKSVLIALNQPHFL